MANGIIIDVGFASKDLEEYINKIKRDFEAIDFGDAISLESSFKEQAKHIRLELDKLEKEIKSSVGGKTVEGLEIQFKDLSKTVNGLVGIVKEIGRGIPKDSNLQNMINDMTELSGYASNVSSAIGDIAKVTKNVDNHELQNTISLLKDLNNLTEQTKSFSIRRKKDEDDVLYLERLGDKINQAYKGYEKLSEEAADIGAIDNPTAIKKNKELLESILLIIDAIEKFNNAETEATRKKNLSLDKFIPSNYGFSLKDLQDELLSQLYGIQDEIRETIAKINLEISQIAEINIPEKRSEAVKKTSDKVSEDLKYEKRSQIQVPLRISDNASDNLYKKTIAIIEELQGRIANKPLEIKVAFTSRYLTNKNQELLNQISENMGNLDDEELKSKLSKLVDDLNRQFDKQLRLDIELKGAKEIYDKTSTLIKNLQQEFENANFTIYPDAKLNDEAKQKISDELNSLIDGVSLNIGIATENGVESDRKKVIKEINILNLLKQKLEEITKQVELKSQAFLDEENFVDLVVKNEIDILDQLYGELIKITDEASEFSSIFKNGININYNVDESSLESVKSIFDQICSLLSNIDSIVSSMDYSKFNKINDNIDSISSIEDLPVLVNENVDADVSKTDKEILEVDRQITKEKEKAVKYTKEQLEFAKQLADNEEIQIKKNGEPYKKDIGRFWKAWQDNQNKSNLYSDDDIVFESNAIIQSNEEIKQSIEAIIESENELDEVHKNASKTKPSSYITNNHLSPFPSLVDENEISNLTKQQQLLEEINLLWQQISINRVGKTNRSAINEKAEMEHLTFLAQKLHELKELGGKVDLQYTNKNDKSLIAKYYNNQFKVSNSKSLGQDAVDGYKIGLLEKIPEVQEMVSQVVKAGLEAAAKTQDSNSPSEEYRKLGNDAMDGYILGIQEKEQELKDAITNVLSGGLTQVKTNGKNVSNLSSLLSTLRGTITSLGGNKSDEKIQKVSDNLQKISQSLSSLNISDSPILTELNNILDKGKELEYLAKAVSGVNSGSVSSNGVDRQTQVANSVKNNETATYYSKLITDAKKYWEYRQKEYSKSITNTEQAELDRIREEYNAIVGLVGIYNVELDATAQSISKVSQKQQDFVSAIEDGGVGYKDYIIYVENRLKSMSENLLNKSSMSKFTSGFKQELSGLSDEIKSTFNNISNLSPDKVFEAIQFYTKQYESIINRIKDIGNKDIFTASTISVQKFAETVARTLSENDNMSKELHSKYVILYNDIDQLLGQSEITKKDASDIALRVKQLGTELEKSSKKGKNFFTMIKDSIISKNSQLIAQYFSWQDYIRYARTLFQSIYNLDTALVDLRKTTSMSTSELNSFYNVSSDLAIEMGVSTKAIIEQAAAWSRLGYSTRDQVEQMAQLSSEFASISPGVDTTMAQEGLVSAMKGFGIEVKNVERDIMDNINKIGNTMATSNGDIINMLERSSAAMRAANNDIRETIALESAAVEITQNAESTGTAFRTISMRLRGYDEDTEDFSEDLQNISGDIADLTKVAGRGGVSIFTDDTRETYKSTYQILKDISEIWDELTDKQQSSLLEKLGGKRGGQVIAGILQDFDRVDYALSQMDSAAGSADAEMNIIKDSFEYKLNAIKETWVQTFKDILSRDDIKEVLDDIVDISKNLGASIKSFSPFFKTLSELVKLLTSLTSSFSGLIPYITLMGVTAKKNFGHTRYANTNVLNSRRLRIFLHGNMALA